MTRFLVCIAALLCALAAPTAALAQGAGDEEYQDPFGDEQAQSEPAPTATPAPAQPAPSQAAPAPTATPSAAQAPTQAAPAPAAAEQLPRTGAGAGWLALAGIVLLAAGLALRRADLQR
jgi:2-oxoglutarate dehydrogenase E2 component (dihydrolipoamide succinyltransferase)